MECPHCKQTNLTFDSDLITLRCPRCGYRLEKTPAAQETPAPSPLAGKPPIKFPMPPGLDMDALPQYLSDYAQVRMRGRLHSAMWALARGNPDEIKKALHAVLEISEDHADTWLCLAAMAEDAAEQRRCLEHVIASQPGHPQAMRLLAELDGKLDPEPPPSSRRRLEPDEIAGARMACPQCGGGLAYDASSRTIACKFCGYHVLNAGDLQRTDTHDTVLAGNLRRKRQAQEWNIGGRWLRCAECGAISTLSRATLTATCRFCQSHQLITEHAAYRFEQPDLIVPFTVTQEAAQAAVEEYLKSGIRWLTRFFADAIARIDLHSSYLAFWVFDADMVVNWSWSKDPAHGQHTVLLSDVPFFAGDAPAASLLEKIEPFDLRQGVDYDPRLLAAHPARLYDLDLPEASLKVRQRLTRDACRRAAPGLRASEPSGYGPNDDAGSLRLNAYTQFLTYRLALLPVWVGQLVEEDGDTRQLLVNGQTGKVTQGRLRKAAR
ncbi:MAG: TFIIB-type zinc ribbon-containing protein [Anaerolineae bacterium]|nr:TFIIB-type zinc ribbon-containing protein [Anaerolineae bacterium]